MIWHHLKWPFLIGGRYWVSALVLRIGKKFEGTVVNVVSPENYQFFAFSQNCPCDFAQTWHVASYCYGGLDGTILHVALLAGWELSVKKSFFHQFWEFLEFFAFFSKTVRRIELNFPNQLVQTSTKEYQSLCLGESTLYTGWRCCSSANSARCYSQFFVTFSR